MPHMDRETTFAALQRYCAERLGADVAAAFMKLARPGFTLAPAAAGREAGHSRFGGAPLLTPGTPWPSCGDYPMSLIAVVDTDALAPWLDGVVPPGTGLLNFFCVDMYSDQADGDVYELLDTYWVGSPELGAVVAAPAATAVAVEAPEGASVFAAEEWAATPGFGFPDTWDPANRLDDVGLDPYELLNLFAERLSDLDQQPGVVATGDIAFGRPAFPTGGSLCMEKGLDPTAFHHLLQLDGEHEFQIGGEGGIMHWSIPSSALAEGDFAKAIPTPDHF